jgi:hypothetical protein
MLSLCQCELLCLVRAARYEIRTAFCVMVLLYGMLRHVDWPVGTDPTEKFPVFSLTDSEDRGSCRHGMVLKKTSIFIFRDIWYYWFPTPPFCANYTLQGLVYKSVPYDFANKY